MTAPRALPHLIRWRPKLLQAAETVFASVGYHEASTVRQAQYVSPGALRLHYTRIVSGYIEGLMGAAGAAAVAVAVREALAAA